MTEPELPQPPSHLAIEMPEAAVVGVYADFVSIWHTEDVFVFDFAALKAAPGPAQTPEGETVNLVQTQVVSRVKVPPNQVFEIMKALNVQLASWEAQTGRSRPPQD